MPAMRQWLMSFPPDVSRHLDRFCSRLAESIDLRGLYVYGSLTTGDFSPARSDIDLVAVTERELDEAALDRLRVIHLDLAAAGGPASRMNCLYVPAEFLGDPDHLHHYWYEDHFTQWQLKVMTQAELAAAGYPLHGDWPVPGLAPVAVADLQAAVHAEVDGYWRRMAAKRSLWLQDNWVDHGLVVLPRAEALLSSGDLITKSEAISRLGDFGVPAQLALQVRRRRDGDQVSLSRLQRTFRARQVQRIMRTAVQRLSAQGPAQLT